jgi:hypothetical protein
MLIGHKDIAETLTATSHGADCHSGAHTRKPAERFTDGEYLVSNRLAIYQEDWQ